MSSQQMAEEAGTDDVRSAAASDPSILMAGCALSRQEIR
jgi:hypothetical protein